MSTIMKLLYSQLDWAQKRRGDGYADAVKSKSQLFSTHFEIDPKVLDEVNDKWPIKQGVIQPPTPHPASAIPPQKQVAQVWPMNAFGVVARALKLMAKPEDVGIGDTIARVIGPIGGDAYKAWFKETFGKTCGCTERQDALNVMFPLLTSPPS
jgi:hypothetical protein